MAVSRAWTEGADYRPVVLVADDDPVVVGGIERQLGRGAHVISALAAHPALRIMESVLCDVVLVGHEVAGESGVALLERLRARFPTARRILMAPPSTSNLREVVGEGVAHGLLPKPIDQGQLAGLVWP